MSIIKGLNITLRNPEVSDAPLWEKWLNDIDIALPLGDELYGKVLERDIVKQIEGYGDSDYYMFTIMTNFGKAIGRCMIFGVDQLNAKATVGIFIGDKEEWGKGYAKEALELLVEYSFRILNLHAIMLGVFEFNTRAIKLYEKVGFKKIGIRRDVRKINGQYVNAVLMDLLEDEYENKYFDFSIMK